MPRARFEAVGDQVEPDLELAFALVARRRDVLFGVLGEVRVAAGPHLADE